MDRRTALRTLAAAGAASFALPDSLSGLLEARRVLACHAPSDPYQPAALTPGQLDLVGVVADIILPPTDTPGATDVGVHEFIDLIVSEWMDDEEADVFVSGLANLDEAARGSRDSSFMELPADERTELVQALDGELMDLHDSDADDAQLRSHFFYWMKRLTLTGFFTSEAGAALMEYRTIPGRFEGCLSTEPAQ